MEELIELIQAFEDVCYSGGAAGADRLFGLYASSVGHTPIHFSFQSHNHCVEEETILDIPSYILNSIPILDMLRTANGKLGRSVPKPGTYVYNLLARNAFQVLCTERVYTIGELVSPTQVAGGTAWAVQMYMDLNETREIYHFNRSDNTVYSFDNSIGEFVPVTSVPKPHGKWTGIGSRSATSADMKRFEEHFI